MSYSIGFVPDEIDDEWEIACQKVCNLLDEWPWLADKINASKLTWPQIMQLVADNI